MEPIGECQRSDRPMISAVIDAADSINLWTPVIDTTLTLTENRIPTI